MFSFMQSQWIAAVVWSNHSRKIKIQALQLDYYIK